MGRIPEGELDSPEATLAYGRQVAAVNRAVRGRPGQRALRMLRDALLALPEKRLCGEVLSDGTNVCALGAICAYEYGKERDLGWAEAMDEFDGIDSEGWATDYVAERFGLARSLAREIMWVNDEHVTTWDYAKKQPIPEDERDAQRYRNVLSYIESLIKTEAA